MKNCQWTVITEVDPITGDLIVPIPQDLLDYLKWCEGDQIELIKQLDHLILRKKP